MSAKRLGAGALMLIALGAVALIAALLPLGLARLVADLWVSVMSVVMGIFGWRARPLAPLVARLSVCARPQQLEAVEPQLLQMIQIEVHHAKRLAGLQGLRTVEVTLASLVDL